MLDASYSYSHLPLGFSQDVKDIEGEKAELIKMLGFVKLVLNRN